MFKFSPTCRSVAFGSEMSFDRPLSMRSVNECAPPAAASPKRATSGSAHVRAVHEQHASTGYWRGRLRYDHALRVITWSGSIVMTRDDSVPDEAAYAISSARFELTSTIDANSNLGSCLQREACHFVPMLVEHEIVWRGSYTLEVPTPQSREAVTFYDLEHRMTIERPVYEYLELVYPVRASGSSFAGPFDGMGTVTGVKLAVPSAHGPILTMERQHVVQPAREHDEEESRQQSRKVARPSWSAWRRRR